MCGICGEIRFDNQPASLTNVQQMVKTLEPRGPDAGGCFAQGSRAFGHRRLKIIDLSESAQQPMVDNELGLGIVFNGAIYNYPELRDQLIKKGYRFFSHGDTEVILKAYHAWGLDFVKKLNGMFAFAIWERDSGQVILGRDRLGIKPLYYSDVSGALRFASSLPALLHTPSINTQLNPVALHHYLTFHSVVPPPHTIVAGIQKLKPAHLLVIDRDGNRQEVNYWQLKFGFQDSGDAQRSFEDWQDEVLKVLRRSIQRRLIADVPVGVLLSGGLDSSLVVGLLHEAGIKELNTFSIGFETVGSEVGHEFEYSDIVAQRFNTQHHRLFVDSQQALPSLQKCIHAMSEPMVSHDNIGFYLLSEKVSKHVKVVQSGQGADEIFGGYHWYPPLLKSQQSVQDYAQVFFDRDHGEMQQLLSRDYYQEDYSRAYVEKHFQQPHADSAIDRALRLDSTVMLVDDPVKRVDNMTMAWGLEARVPFLDHEVVELAARIPPELKVQEGGKWVLKEAARRVIPREVIDRPKGYFPVPALKYLRGKFLDLVKDVLSPEQIQTRGLFQQTYVKNLLANPDQHLTPLRGSKLWQLALLELWLQEHQIA